MIRKRKRKEETPPIPKTRAELEDKYGQVWNTAQLAKDFVITAIIGNTVVVRRKCDAKVGALQVQERPRFYFGFRTV